MLLVLCLLGSAFRQEASLNLQPVKRYFFGTVPHAFYLGESVVIGGTGEVPCSCEVYRIVK